jgi:hypothetical protein
MMRIAKTLWKVVVVPVRTRGVVGRELVAVDQALTGTSDVENGVYLSCQMKMFISQSTRGVGLRIVQASSGSFVLLLHFGISYRGVDVKAVGVEVDGGECIGFMVVSSPTGFAGRLVVRVSVN